MLQHVLDAQLGTVAHRPNAVELQAIAHAVFLDEHSCCTTARNKIDALGVKRRDGRVEAASIVHVEEAGAVGPDERAADRVNRINDMFLDFSAFVALLRETCTDNDEAFAPFLFGQHINGLGAKLGGNAKNGTFHLRKVIHLGIALNALNLSFFGIHGINRATERALQKVLQCFSTGFVDVGRSTAHYDAFRVE